MTIQTGDTLPNATLFRMGEGDPEPVALHDLIANKKAVIFGLPGAFTGTCSTAHLPSFIRSKEALEAAAVQAVICVSVNDAFVMDAWAKSTGADAAEILMLGDPTGEFTKALGLDFSAAHVGLFDRSKRYTMLVDKGIVQVLNVEEDAGMCQLSAAETLVDQIA